MRTSQMSSLSPLIVQPCVSVSIQPEGSPATITGIQISRLVYEVTRKRLTFSYAACTQAPGGPKTGRSSTISSSTLLWTPTLRYQHRVASVIIRHVLLMKPKKAPRPSSIFTKGGHEAKGLLNRQRALLRRYLQDTLPPWDNAQETCWIALTYWYKNSSRCQLALDSLRGYHLNNGMQSLCRTDGITDELRGCHELPLRACHGSLYRHQPSNSRA